jgi:hypothetical protein
VTEFPWYLLRVRERKIFLFLLMKAQAPVDTNLKMIGPLNFKTLSEVGLSELFQNGCSIFHFHFKIIKIIYSVFMLLSSLLD